MKESVKETAEKEKAPPEIKGRKEGKVTETEDFWQNLWQAMTERNGPVPEPEGKLAVAVPEVVDFVNVHPTKVVYVIEPEERTLPQNRGLHTRDLTGRGGLVAVRPGSKQVVEVEV